MRGNAGNSLDPLRSLGFYAGMTVTAMATLLGVFWGQESGGPGAGGGDDAGLGGSSRGSRAGDCGIWLPGAMGAGM